MESNAPPGTVHGKATWACYNDPGVGWLWYIKLDGRKPPPYTRCTEVTATIDVDRDGCLAGIAIISGKLPGPPAPRSGA